MFDHVHVAQDRVCGPAVPLGDLAARDIRLQQLHAALVPVEVPRPAEADVIVERARVVLRQDDDVVDVGVDAVGQREVDDPVLPTERHGRLRPFLRQDRQALAFTTREDDRHRALRSQGAPPDVDGVCSMGVCRWGSVGDASTGSRRLSPVRASTFGEPRYRNRRGFTKLPLSSVIQCRCGPVAWPVLPS